MVLVDTSAWIEWLIGSPTGDKLTQHLPEQADWLVPTMVQLELAQVCQIVPLDTEIALAAADACRGHKLATADAIIFATARLRGATLLTSDAHFDGLPGVTLIAKTGA
uniref:type II toxin-antitoxin system VapC family toxin n=1 Tax=Yoonia sp. TaxID=2212373 RepID=UPI004047A771